MHSLSFPCGKPCVFPVDENGSFPQYSYCSLFPESIHFTYSQIVENYPSLILVRILSTVSANESSSLIICEIFLQAEIAVV